MKRRNNLGENTMAAFNTFTCCCSRSLAVPGNVHSPFSTFCSDANAHSLMDKATDPGTNEAAQLKYSGHMKGVLRSWAGVTQENSHRQKFVFKSRDFRPDFWQRKLGSCWRRSEQPSFLSLLLRQRGTDMRRGDNQWHSAGGRGGATTRKREEESVVNVHAKQCLKDL